MNTSTLISWIGLAGTLIAYIVTIVIFLTHQSDGLKTLQTSFKELKEDIKDFKNDIKEKIRENQKHTEDHIKRLESKQDKHNNLIERMAIVEQSTKSAHHRIDDIKGGT